MGDNQLGAGPFYRAADLDTARCQLLRRRAREGQLIRINTGVYVEPAYWHALSQTDKKKAHAVMMARRVGAPLVGRTAALFHRFPLPFSLTDIPVEIAAGIPFIQNSRHHILPRNFEPVIGSSIFLCPGKCKFIFRDAAALSDCFQSAVHPLPQFYCKLVQSQFHSPVPFFGCM